MDQKTAEQVLTEAFAASKPTWHDVYGESKMVDSQGQIVGRVTKKMGSGDWYAMRGVKRVGEYVSQEAAKRAVERSGGYE